MNRRGWIGSSILVLVVLGAGAGVAAWKVGAIQQQEAAAANHPEPMEVVTAAVAQEREHQRTTTSIGTVLALRSITLRNELAGTVRQVMLTPGQIVEPNTVLVALDVSVEEAELAAQEAQAAFAQTDFERLQRLLQDQAAANIELDRARAARDVARAQIERIRAVIQKKTIRAPFRARVGMADVHVGQYLDAGTPLTTLQGVDDAVHVDFTVTQQVAASLQEGDAVEVSPAGDGAVIRAEIVAIDARVDPTTRNAWVRARIVGDAPAPGSSVRVRVPVGEPQTAVAVPVSALRKGPAGDYVFVIAPGEDGRPRARMRPVQSGAMLGDEILVLAGLGPGEEIAAAGSFKLRDGVLVAVGGDTPVVAKGH